ncbi:uncharacterized protein EDB91DRAFT_59015 [Suillus paluster]|uniref:uncharacterized protein n=1 Tax=Suillus paluster TaxID=48578 RepID=UPI001B87A61E|nr:uncharacterized protein EDB91DRAFT_59015 [Suillus paluster]KAG1726530.1 hypothetical protein EDB91DRAFT_59015 [Suillus paluster]
MISIGRFCLDNHWKSKEDEVKWERHRQKVVERLNNINIVAGLVLTTSAIFLSTQPPLTSFLPYTTRACYVFAFGSFAHALGGLACGIAVVNIYEVSDREWTRDVLMGTRARVCYTLMLMSWPAMSLTISIVFLTICLLTACYASGVWWLQLLAAIEILTWVWLPPVFVWCALGKKAMSKADEEASIGITANSADREACGGRRS